MNDWSNLFSKLQQAVFSKRPFLEKIVRKRGHKTLYAYATEYISINLNRHPALLAITTEDITRHTV